ncbi:hypothetical protein FSP39_024887 [Pinctada imbricata]|uniref:Mismatch repair endonuclease PMS2 n=1 Tax=Pinctada imbricata TaxID=66713 RepID=A0AA88XUL3_PINIB|nr:hypothetical protein FSP39_024887 [Pinctada imbricata]
MLKTLHRTEQNEASNTCICYLSVGIRFVCYSSVTPLVAVHEEVPPVAKSIKAIDRGSVHRICSGQVVLTLATAVKELVENSVDAGATIIEVRLKEYGSELIEVSDNGSGVEEKDFEGLTLKHHTSKIQDFSDVVNVETFGFRGEALSSLCALSSLSIVTRHKTANVGTKLDIDHNGKIKEKSSVARQIGTTVSLQNLFYTLPVRHKEFQRNIKKEFAKLVQVLNSYCIISTGVRITCSNQVGKGNRSVVVSSNGNSSMKENIANVFGSKQVASLLAFEKIQPNEDISTEFSIKVTEETFKQFSIEGFISKCEHGQGRGSSDRQFYFINKRPWDSSKMSKIVNEVYHQFNRHQYPFVAVHVTMARDLVDANVTPDKRQIFMQDEKILLAVIKPTLSSCLGRLKRSFSSAFTKSDSSISPVKGKNTPTQPNKQRRLDCFVSRSASSSGIDNESSFTFKDNLSYNETDSRTDSTGKNDQNGDFMSNVKIYHHTDSNNKENHIQSDRTTVDNVGVSGDTDVLVVREDKSVSIEIPSTPSCLQDTVSFDSQHTKSSTSDSQQSSNGRDSFTENVLFKRNSYNVSSDSGLSCDIDEPDGASTYDIDTTVHIASPCKVEDNGSSAQEVLSHTPDIESNQSEGSTCTVKVTQYDEKEVQHKLEKKVQFNLVSLRQKMKLKTELKNEEAFCRSFRATISPSENQAAEEELQKEIKKEMFSKMKILGQFNLGFIIVKLGEDLFIVDQHASDEKYNFEMLQRHTVIQNQKLIQPQNLELTASNETILMDNLEVFRKNGFDFIINEEGVPTQRVKLTSIPVSKNWTFGKDGKILYDLERLHFVALFYLCDGMGVMCRPTRVRQMFASRACRKSIMIGTALRKSEMKKLIFHMGEIEQPWNCPHGRPTMRHLINLNMLRR